MKNLKEQYMITLEKIKESADFIKERTKICPKIAITLGSGLGGLVNHLEVEEEFPYKDIPHFPQSTVKGHRGSLIFGKLNNVPIMALAGRFHYYEGYTMQEVVFPVQVMKELGVKKLILSNAAGGMNPTFKVGDIMIIKDHINMFGVNPLLGYNDDRIGPRFLDMSEAYSKSMIKLALVTAEKLAIHLQQGVYAGVTGPCYETPAEYRMFHILGADAVGMSTVPETITARHIGIEVFAFSVISDLGVIGQVEKISHEEVLAEAAKAEPKMVKLVYEMLPLLSK